MTGASNERPNSLPQREAAELVALVRRNLSLLAELVSRYEVGYVEPNASDVVVRQPTDVVRYLGPELIDLVQEQLRVVLLDTRHHVLGTQLIYQGGLNATVIRLADCFREAVARGAAAVVFVHNHPSGDPSASHDDVTFTTEAGRVGNLLGIPLLDHVIIAREGHVSLRARGLYWLPRSEDEGHGGEATSEADHV